MRYAMSFVLALSLFGLPAFMGCDREVSHEETVSHPITGGTKVQEKTVTQNPDGTLNKKTETHTAP